MVTSLQSLMGQETQADDQADWNSSGIYWYMMVHKLTGVGSKSRQKRRRICRLTGIGQIQVKEQVTGYRLQVQGSRFPEAEKQRHEATLTVWKGADGDGLVHILRG